ncbi:AAA family ATPase [Candidatus Sumerlaeota bacterium]|nr:AAA family ATPase [Candidatus Sumerlaeota bacterium]
MKVTIKKLALEGFKTIQKLDFDPKSLNVLIGPNGSGKSNFISFFHLLSWMMSGDPRQGLQTYVAQQGGAHAILHDGPEKTRNITAELSLEWDPGINSYGFNLSWAAPDTVIFTDEKYLYLPRGSTSDPRWTLLGVGQREALLTSQEQVLGRTPQVIRDLLRSIIVYQFHNTSFTSRFRQPSLITDSYLKFDGANLASFLYRINQFKRKEYERIVDTLRLILPFFSDFEFRPANGMVLLQWRERNSDLIFDAHQASDGMLRTMALVALLGQPEGDLPDVMILDEPELGLHPYAITIIAGMIKASALHSQIILATQSPQLVDEFDPEDIVVVERKERASTFRRLSEEELRDWLGDYALSELWEKNVIGGRPSR